MKKLLFLSAAAIMFAAGVNAQTAMLTAKKEKKEDRKELRKLNGNVVSEASKQLFSRDYGNIPGTKWRRTANFDEATFKKNGKEMTAFYDDQSDLVGTTSIATFASLPAKGRKFINAKYKGYTKRGVIFFDDNEANDTDMMLYGQQFDDVDSYFVSLKKNNKTIIVQVSMNGEVSYFASM